MADSKIKDLTAKTTVVDSDEIIINDVAGGNLDKKEGMDDIKTYMHIGITSVIEFVIDGGGAALTTGVKAYLEIPFGCTINRVTMLADVSGSAVVDIWNDTYANYPPTDADTITASAVPTISTATKSQDSTLTGWTTTITAGDILAFNVDSATTITKLTVSLKVTRT